MHRTPAAFVVACTLLEAFTPTSAHTQPLRGASSDFRRALSAPAARAVLALRGRLGAGRRAQAPFAQAPLILGPQVSGTNVLVNDPSLDTPDMTTQSETTLAVSGTTVCAGYNDSGSFPTAFSGFSRSTDGGALWMDQGPTGPSRSGDPSLAAHRASGTFYFGEIAFTGNSSPAGTRRSIVGVAKSTDDCQSFPTLIAASPAIAPASVCAAGRECSPCRQNADCDTALGRGDGRCTAPDLQDKPWITADDTGGARDGNVYVCWTRFVDQFVRGGPSSAEIVFTRSTDQGATFGDEQVLSFLSDSFPIGCHITVGPSGEVDVAWADRGGDFPIRFRRSLDGGLTWGAPVQVNHATIRHPGIDRLVSFQTEICGAPVTASRPTLNGDIRMTAQAWMAEDTSAGPFRRNVYVAWASDPPGDADNSDVLFSRSTDGGLTWSPEIQIGGGTVTDQFEPFVAVGGNGTVAIAWYDRRNDPDNNYDIDVYTAFSRDGGLSFEPIIRLTDASFPVPPLAGQPTDSGQFDPQVQAYYMGEYIAVAADAGNFYYAWGDNRDTVVSTNYPTGRPDPDVFFARHAVPPLCVGDCDGNGTVTVDELLVMVNVALGAAPVSACPAGDANGDGQITVDELLLAVNSALNGCGFGAS